VPEDSYAAYAWLALLGGVAVFVIVFDLWAYHSHHKMMTTQFRLWLLSPIVGPFIVAFWVGALAGLSDHLFLRR